MAVSTWDSSTAGSWRDTDGWRTENYAYQGDWGWGKHRGYWFFNDANIRATLAGQDIISVRFGITRVNNTHGSPSAGVPTIRLHNYSSQPSGTPAVSTTGTSNHGASFTRGEFDWATLPPEWGERLRDGTAKGLGVYTTSSSPYLIFESEVALEITYEPSIDAPPTPTGFQLTGATTSSVALACDVAGSVAGNNLASHYRFDRESGGSSLRSTNTFTNSGLQSGYEDRWRVRAENAGGVSSYTGWLTGRTVPSAPVGLNHSSSTTSTIEMAWSATPGANQGYRVERDGGPALAAPGETFVSTGLIPGTSYQFRVRAESSEPNGTGGNSTYSDWVTMWTKPVAPSIPTVDSATHDAISISWNSVAGATSYSVERQVSGGIFETVRDQSGTSWTDTGLESGIVYGYRVRAETPGGPGAWSGVRTIGTVPPPDAPAGLSVADKGTNFITLQWSAIADAAVYRIQRLSLFNQVQKTWTTSGLTITDYTVQPGIAYRYRVRAESDLGSPSSYSSYLQVGADSLPQDAPRLDDVDNFSALWSKTFEWTFISGNISDAQVARQIQIRRVSDTVVVVNDTATTDSESYTVPGFTLSNDIEYEWRVRTQDSFELSFGPWSDYQRFETISTPSVFITLPVEGSSYTGQELAVAWIYSQSASRPQSEFRVYVYSSGATLEFDSGWVQSSEDSYNVPGLESGTYEVFVNVGSGGVRGSEDSAANVTVSTNTMVFEQDGADVVWLNNDEGTEAGDGVFRFNMQTPTASGIETYNLFPKGNGWQKYPGEPPAGNPTGDGWMAVLETNHQRGSNIVLSFKAKVTDKSGNIAWDNVAFPSHFQIRVITDFETTYTTSSPVFLDEAQQDASIGDEGWSDVRPKYVEVENGYRHYTTSISARHPAKKIELIANFSATAEPRYLYITNLDVHRSGTIYSEEYLDTGFDGGLMLSGDGYMLGSRIELMGASPEQRSRLNSYGLYFPKAFVQVGSSERSYMAMIAQGQTVQYANDAQLFLYSADDNSDRAGRVEISGPSGIVTYQPILGRYGTASAPSYSFLNDPDTGIIRHSTDTLGFVTGGTTKFHLDSQGRFVSDITNVNPSQGGGNQNAVGLWSDGYLLISRAVDTAIQVNRGNDGAAQLFKRAGSTVGSVTVSASAAAFNTSSDYRLKTNDEPIENALERIEQLRPIGFTWVRDGSRDEGFFAHEAAQAVPNAVTGTRDAVDENGDPDYQMIDYSRVVPLLTAAVKELSSKVTELELELRSKG